MLGIILLAGDKNSISTIKNVVKTYNELRRKQTEIVNELKREFNEIAQSNEEIVRPLSEVSRTMYYETTNDTPVNYSIKDYKMDMLEQRIKELEKELNELKKNRGVDNELSEGKGG